MLYTIVQDIPGRLRLRCGKGMISSEEACGIVQAIRSLDGVSEARVSSANGSILVIYRGQQARSDALSLVDGFSILSLPTAVSDTSIAMAHENNEFYRTVITMIGRRFVRRMFLPRPVRMAITIFRSVGFIVKGLHHLLRGELTVEVLDATAIVASLLQRQFASAGSVMFLLNLSDVLQEHANARTRLALAESLMIRAEKVWAVNEDGKDVEVRMEDVECGMLVRVRTGQSIPVDGTVLDGEGEVNEASMTGESALVHKHADSTVFAGTVCEDGNMIIRVDALPGASRIDQIVSMVEESSNLKAGAQSRAEHMADALVPINFIAFFAVLALTRNITKALSVLMVDYSCAIKLTMPVAVMSAMREASARGAVIKGGKYLEALAESDVVVFDKTGTLTKSAPEVEKVILTGDMDGESALKLAACLEEHFPHSLARAVVQAAVDRGIHHEEEDHAEVEYIVAHGIASYAQGKKVVLGSAHFVFDDEGVEMPEGIMEHLQQEAPMASTIFMGVDGKLEAVLCVSDPLREEARGVVSRLRELGIRKFVMLTGDSPIAAQAVAAKVGIDEFHAQVLPEDKSRYVEDLKAAGHKVIMVGDGINDSPALAAANVSIALNDASDVARAVADVGVLDSSLESLVMLRELSEGLMNRIHSNYQFIVAFNTALIASGLFGLMSPTIGAYLHNGSTVAITGANTRPLLRAAQNK